MAWFVVGDVHGCLQEFEELLRVAGVGPRDKVVAVGDLVDRGPATPGVLAYFSRRAHFHSVRGNHEHKHLEADQLAVGPPKVSREGPPPRLPELAREGLGLSPTLTRAALDEAQYARLLATIATFPFHLEIPDAHVIHAFLDPCVPLASQREAVLVGLPGVQAALHARYARPWYELYQGDKPVVVGHVDYGVKGAPLVHEERVYGIDTGCCHGGRLTGLWLPDFELVSVPAARSYWRDAKASWLAERVLPNLAELSPAEITRLRHKLRRDPGLLGVLDRALTK